MFACHQNKQPNARQTFERTTGVSQTRISRCTQAHAHASTCNGTVHTKDATMEHSPNLAQHPYSMRYENCSTEVRSLWLAPLQIGNKIGNTASVSMHSTPSVFSPCTPALAQTF